MQKATIAFLLAFALITPAFAQTDSLRREIGFSTQIIFDNIFESQGAPFALMFKKQTKKGLWMRYGLNFQVYRQEQTNPDVNRRNDHLTKYLFVSPAIGLEGRTVLSNRWNIVYGGDLYASFSHKNTETIYSYDNSQNISEQRREEQHVGAGIRPFIGLMFLITPRLSLATEASANLQGTRGSHSFYQNQDGMVDETNESLWNYNFSLRPASAIYVYYRF